MSMSSKKVILGALLGLALPMLAGAQAAQDDLHAAIWASLLRDPRTASIPPEEMQALVDQLAVEAQAQHMSAADILAHHEESAAFAATSASEPECDTGIKGYLCAVNKSFGFGGDDMLIPALLFGSSGLLALIIRRMRINAKAHLAAQAASSPPWAAPL